MPNVRAKERKRVRKKNGIKKRGGLFQEVLLWANFSISTTFKVVLFDHGLQSYTNLERKTDKVFWNINKTKMDLKDRMK